MPIYKDVTYEIKIREFSGDAAGYEVIFPNGSTIVGSILFVVPNEQAEEIAHRMAKKSIDRGTWCNVKTKS